MNAHVSQSRPALRFLRAIACAIAVLSATAPSAAARAELTVSPTILEVDAKAGQSIIEPIAISAGEDEPIVVELVHADFGFDDSSYQVTLIRDDAEETTAFSTRGWFSLPKDRYRIPAGRTMQLPLRIDIPDNTPGGTYLGAALFRVVPPDAAPGASQVQAVPETGPLLFIAVAGGDPPKAALRRFEVPRLVGEGPIRPEIVVENRGDAHFNYEGTITLRGPGKDDTVEVTRQFVVPGQPRRLRTSADDKGDEGRPVLGSERLGFGRYEVRTRLRIEPTGTTLVSTRTVWVVPAWAWTLLGLIAMVVAVSIALLVRWYLERRRLAPFLAEAQAEFEREATPGYAIDGELDEDELDEDDLDDEGLDVDGLADDDLDPDDPVVR